MSSPQRSGGWLPEIDVETAVPHALQHGSFFFADIEKNQVDAVGLEVLRRMARSGETAVTPRPTLVEHIPSLLQLEEALAQLQHRELIEPLDHGYRFQVELIRRWFGERPRSTMLASVQINCC